MLDDQTVTTLALLACAAPALSSVALAALLMAGMVPSERTVTRVARAALLTSLASTLLVFAAYLQRGKLALRLGHWFQSASYGFEVHLLVDRLSVTMLLCVSVLTALIGRFSFRYLHRERGFARFFFLLSLFHLGMTVLVLAGTLDLLFAGWELVGVSSMLLIAFFHHRSGPAQNALWAFVTYRVCDAGLLMGAVLLHHYAHTAALDDTFGHLPWPHGAVHLPPGASTLVGFLLLFAAMGKSAQFPFGTWLPRAMEGPTPSSAIFYGALSIHAGAYLLLRCAPLYEQSANARLAVLAVGITTALYATLSGRTQTDAKSVLAYASMTQVGLIFAEIGVGLYELALFHMGAHATLRSFQLLRAPSVLHDTYARVAAAEGRRPREGALYERLMSAPMRELLYRLSLERFHLDGFVLALSERIVRVSRFLDGLEREWVRLLSAWPEPKATAQAREADAMARSEKP